MTFGDRITYQRKQKKWSQDELAKKVGTSAPIIGRYERDEINPSIDVAAKIADALEVSLDFLVGASSLMLDKPTLKRLEDIGKLPEDAKQYIFDHIDMMIRDFKTKKAYAK